MDNRVFMDETSLKILTYPNTHLETPTIDVVNFDDTFKAKVQQLKTLLVNTGNALAIAANQVGWTESFFIMKDKKNDIHVFVNPKIIKECNEYQLQKEGCLSFPDIFLDVPRPNFAYIKAQKEDGQEFEVVLQELEATIAYHEIDHLLGKTFIEQVSRQQRRFVEREMMKRK